MIVAGSKAALGRGFLPSMRHCFASHDGPRQPEISHNAGRQVAAVLSTLGSCADCAPAGLGCRIHGG